MIQQTITVEKFRLEMVEMVNKIFVRIRICTNKRYKINTLILWEYDKEDDICIHSFILIIFYFFLKKEKVHYQNLVSHAKTPLFEITLN